MTTRHLLTYKGHSDFDSVNTMVATLAQAFAELGWEVSCVDLRDGDAARQAATLVTERGVDLVLSLNGYGIPAGGDIGFYAGLAAPVVVLFVDHPVYHHPTIRTAVPTLRVSFPTAHHVDFCRDFVRADIPLGHIGHAASAADPADLRPWAERDIGVLVPSSLAVMPEEDRRGWADQYGTEVAARLHAVIEEHEDDPTAPLHHCIQRVAGAVSLNLMHAYFSVADRYLRARAKLDGVRAMAAAGLRPWVCGPGWPDLASTALQRGTTPVAEVFRLMGRARIVANLLPPYYHSHERPFQGAAHGAVAASSPSPWLRQIWNGQILTLSTDSSEAAEQLRTALADDDSLGQRARQGQQIVCSHHLWHHRAVEILRFAGLDSPDAG